MKKLIDKYLNNNIPVEERVFYLAIFMGTVASLIFVSIFAFTRIDLFSMVLYALMCAIGTILFFLESRVNKPKLLSFIYLTCINVIILPVILCLSKNLTVEVPLYMLIGITYAFVLLDGKTRIIQFLMQIIAVGSSSYYCYIIKQGDNIVRGAVTPVEFIRLEIAILTSGVLCGTIVSYKNKLLASEMLKKEEANSKAEKVSYAKDMFLVNVSHEIRTPLNAIIGTTDILLNSETTNHIREMAYNISNSSHALLSITTDLLDFSRMNMDSLEPEKEKYDISALLNDIVNLMSVRLLDSNVEFFTTVNPNLPKYLIGDSGKVRQIIINMLSNAIKYTKEGHMNFEVDFEKKDSQNILLHFRVSDTGIGIRSENLEKIFEPYNRSGENTDRVIDGNGLGLALCKKLSNLMGGSIWAESEYGVGSTFFFDVPQAVSEEAITVGTVDKKASVVVCFTDNKADGDAFEKACDSMNVYCKRLFSDEEFVGYINDDNYAFFFLDTSSYERLKSTMKEQVSDWNKIVIISDCNYSYSDEPFETVLSKPVNCLKIADTLNNKRVFTEKKKNINGTLSIEGATILVVDDNIINLTVAAGLLEKYKPTVITAASGKEALNLLLTESVDLIFLDYMMPDMDGIDTLKAIRELPNPVYQTLPVVTLTANVVSGAREMFLDAGFNDYLSKPIEIDMLEKILKDYVPKKYINFV